MVQTLVSIASEENSFSLSEERQLVKGRLLHTFPVLAKEWKVSFEVKPSTFEDGWRNILRLWYGATNIGVSCLSISIQSSRECNDRQQCFITPIRLAFQFTPDGHQQKTSYVHSIPQLNEWTKIEVSQMLDGKTYKILFNNGSITKEVPRPNIFEGVKVYASAPWNEPQPGKIRDLRITNLNSG